MTQPLAHALGFGASWLALSLLIAASPLFGRTKQQRARNLPLNPEQRALRRSIVITGVVSALCGIIVAWLHGNGSNFIPTMLLALVGAALSATVMLVVYTVGSHRRQLPVERPVTRYRFRPQPSDVTHPLKGDLRDGPHT